MIKLSNPLNNVDEELKSIKSIKEENDALTIRNASLKKQIIANDEERYNEFTVDLYEHNVIDKETLIDIKDNYSNDKRKDDFER